MIEAKMYLLKVLLFVKTPEKSFTLIKQLIPGYSWL